MRRQTAVDSHLRRILVFLSAGRRFVALHTDTAAVAVFTDFKTVMFGASISPLVTLHSAPPGNQNAAGLFRFRVTTTLTLREFRSLLSGCIHNIYNTCNVIAPRIHLPVTLPILPTIAKRAALTARIPPPTVALRIPLAKVRSRFLFTWSATSEW